VASSFDDETRAPMLPQGAGGSRYRAIDPSRRFFAAVLTEDRVLALLVDEDCRPVVEHWLPRHVQLAPGKSLEATRAQAILHVRLASGEARASESPTASSIARFGSIVLRQSEQSVQRLTIECEEPATAFGFIDLAGRYAEVSANPAQGLDASIVSPAITLSAALLLGSLGRALVHAAAVVAPDGRAWVVAGDTHTGKTTLCATLLEAGWSYCSDDHIVVRQANTTELSLEGWPRPFHIDAGWDTGAPRGGRVPVDPFAQWPGQWKSSAPLGGVLLPSVDADHATRLVEIRPANRLAALIRQSPWLFTDLDAAPIVLRVLRAAALLPGAAIRLGRDSFRKPDRLREVLAPLTERRPDSPSLT
jgi:hypothetical protein